MLSGAAGRDVGGVVEVEGEDNIDKRSLLNHRGGEVYAKQRRNPT